MSSRRRGSGRDPEPDPYRNTIIILGITLGLVAFGVMGYALWTGDATTGTDAPDGNADGLEEALNDTEPPEAPSSGGEGGGNTTDGQANETDGNATQGGSGETNESSNESTGSNPGLEQPDNETTPNQTAPNQQNQSNQTTSNQQNQANQPNQTNQSNQTQQRGLYAH